MSADDNLAHAEKAIKLTKTHISCSNNLRGDRLASFENGIETLVELWKTNPQLQLEKNNPNPIGHIIAPVHDKAEFVRSKGISPTSVTNIFAMANNVIQSKTAYGNCMEQAAFAFCYLYKWGVKPIDYMCFSSRAKDKANRPMYDHAWLVIGLDSSATMTDMRSWGKSAVWCDPWQMKDGRAFKITDLIAGRIRNLDWQFRLDTANRIEVGEPMTLVRHE